MDVAAELGGIAALTGAIVIVTGIVGALLAETVCKLFHITQKPLVFKSLYIWKNRSYNHF